MSVCVCNKYLKPICIIALYKKDYRLSLYQKKFGANKLDERNWVVDFGGLKELEKWLRNHFDHKTLVASDDPELSKFRDLDNDGIIQMIVVESTGAEMFAKMAMEYSTSLIQENYSGRCWVESVTVREHGANSATCSV